MPQPSGHARRFKADMNRRNRKLQIERKTKTNKTFKSSLLPLFSPPGIG